MKLLLIADDLWHPGEVVRRGLRFLDAKGYEIDWIMDAKDIVTPQLLKEYDAVIIAKANALIGSNAAAPWFEPGITYVSPEGYKQYVEEGGAVLIFHAGAAFNKNDCLPMCEFIGTSFITHPPQSKVDFKVTKPEHPIMKGVCDFSFPQDEHYQLEFLTDSFDIFAHTESAAGGVQPAGMTRTYGDGRLCVLTPGHNAFAIDVPGYQQVIINALDWITKKI